MRTAAIAGDVVIPAKAGIQVRPHRANWAPAFAKATADYVVSFGPRMNITKAHAWCATLPGATLDHKWQFEDSVHPVYSVGGRMFAMFSMKAGKLVDTLMFKADDVRFLELTDREGIVPAPYLARAKWVKVEGVQRLSDAELKQLLGEAHRVVLAKSSKKMQTAILAGTSPVETPPKVAAKRSSSRASETATPKPAVKRPKR